MNGIRHVLKEPTVLEQKAKSLGESQQGGGKDDRDDTPDIHF
jgi:hypothetical protein